MQKMYSTGDRNQSENARQKLVGILAQKLRVSMYSQLFSDDIY